MSVQITRTHWFDERVTAFRDQMDAEIQPSYAHVRDQVPRVEVDTDTILVTLIATSGGEPVGTVALKRTGDFGEVKRLFVHERGRRLGVAVALMTAIEQAASEEGFRELFLQTGSEQPQAMALYEREGWIPVTPFGPYAGDTILSRCYVKNLVSPIVAAEVRQDGSVDGVLSTITALDEAGADLALVDDGTLDGAGGSSLDAPLVAAAAVTEAPRIAVAPRVRVTHTEPFNVAKAIQSLDWSSAGRAGWLVGVSETAAEASAVGRRPAPESETAWAEAAAVIDTSRRLWDSWEDDAEIRDESTGRFIDAGRVHYVDVETEWFSVKGPSIVPRSPQGQIPVIVEAALDDSSLEIAAAEAEIVRVAGPRAGETARRVRELAGARPVRVLVDLDPESVNAAPHARSDDEQLAAWAAFVRAESDADGVVLTGSAAANARAARAIAGARGSARTLRERIGLERPASRYAAPEGTTR
ncbi:MAG: LLM class flavin-dependent oxidoreductase [Microbacterium gubbeenense]|uniref:LLM class flavin-dependent oxidoreductase n=1 Tax=Microbacterium gubbeenense TaxID=159896 RepID=UPI003F95BF59